jgi:hypothetical protein
MLDCRYCRIRLISEPSHALAQVRSRSTVRRETPSTSAMYSCVSQEIHDTRTTAHGDASR